MNSSDRQFHAAASAESIDSPADYPQVTQQLSEHVILTTLDTLYAWARLSSLWHLLYETACCFIEFAALIGSQFDFDPFGLIPQQALANGERGKLAKDRGFETIFNCLEQMGDSAKETV